MSKSRPSGARTAGSGVSSSGSNKASGEAYSPGATVEKKTGMRLSPEEYRRMVALRNEIKEYTKRFSGENAHVVNRSTGMDIHITRKSIKEAVNGPRKIEEIEALRRLPSMLKRATYEGPQKNLKPDVKPDIIRYHIFNAKRKIFGKKYDFAIKIEEYANGKFFHDSYTIK